MSITWIEVPEENTRIYLSEHLSTIARDNQAVSLAEAADENLVFSITKLFQCIEEHPTPSLMEYCAKINEVFADMARHTRFEMLKLLRPKADINFSQTFSYSALQWAVCNNNMELTVWLINEGAEIHQKELLVIAAEKDHLELARYLIKAGVNINETCQYLFKTPLHTATENGHIEMVELLLTHGAELQRNYQKHTPLDVAKIFKYINNRKEIISLLKMSLKKQLESLPNFNQRKAALSILITGKNLDQSIILSDLAEMSENYPLDVLEIWVKKAESLAQNDNEGLIHIRHFIRLAVYFDTGLLSLVPETCTRKKRTVALHEAGHALIAHILGFTPHYIDIHRGNYHGGITAMSYCNDPSTEILILLGGKAAEEIFEVNSQGCDQDLKEAHRFGKKLIKKDPGNTEQTIINEHMLKTKEILKNHKSLLNKLAEAMMDTNYLSKRDFLSIVESEKTEHKKIFWSATAGFFNKRFVSANEPSLTAKFAPS